jgi:hypothetical protein
MSAMIPEQSIFLGGNGERHRAGHARIHARERALEGAEYAEGGIASKLLGSLALLGSGIRHLYRQHMVPPPVTNTPFMTPDQMLDPYPAPVHSIDIDTDIAA